VSRHLEIADAAVTALNGHTFSQVFTAERKALALRKREECASLVVSLTPSTYASEIASRSKRLKRFGVDVAVQKAVDPEIAAEFDPLADLLEEIDVFFAMERLPGLTAAVWEKAETISGAEAGWAHEHLDKHQLFTGVLRVTWKVIE
jgi:hypothetical protein